MDEWKETAIEDRTIGNDEFLSIFHQVYRLRSVLSFFVFRIDRLRDFRWENHDEANSERNDRVGITISIRILKLCRVIFRFFVGRLCLKKRSEK